MLNEASALTCNFFDWPWIRDSGWEFVTSGGASVGISTPIAKVGVAGCGGMLKLRRTSDSKILSLTYGGFGGSVGLSPVPTPINFTYAVPEMPSAGKVYSLPASGLSLTEGELRGVMVLLEASADIGPALAGSMMFLGGDPSLAALLLAMTSPMGPAVSITSALTSLLASSEACICFGGLAHTLIPFNLSFTVSLGLVR